MITYYIRDRENKPRITVAIERVLDGGKFILVRGVALCSMKDNPCKKTGRNIAEGLLNKALAHVKSCNNTFIQRDEALQVLDECLNPWDVNQAVSEPPYYRCEYNTPPWNKLERKYLYKQDKQV